MSVPGLDQSRLKVNMPATARNLSEWIALFFMLPAHHVLLAYSELIAMHPETILNACASSCVVLSLDKNVAAAEVLDLMQSLADVSFRNESSVMIGEFRPHLNPDVFWPNSQPLKVQGGLEKDGLSQSIFIFQQLKKDRTCLLEPRKANLPAVIQHKVLQETKRSEFIRSDALSIAVKIINQYCGSFRNSDGSINNKGLHRNEILDNLFHSESKAHDESSYSSPYIMDDKRNLQPKPDSCRVKEIDECQMQDVKFKHSEAISYDYEECERIPIPTSVNFFHDYLSLSKPVIITGATAEWPAFQKWTKEFLKSKYGKTRVHIKATPNGDYEGVEDKSLWKTEKNFRIPKQVEQQLPHPDLVVVRPASLEMQFSEFLGLIENVSRGINVNMSAYLEYSSIRDYFPELNSDITRLDFISMLELASVNIWLSDGNTLGKLHFDPFDNLLCQISGEKHVTLFNPHNNERLYEGHIQESQFMYNKSTGSFRRSKLLDSTSMVMSPVDLGKPNLKRFPLFADTRPMKCSIKAGEVLFMPAFWWHEVQSRPNVSEHRNLAVNFWYKPFLTKEFPCAECRLDVNPHYYHLL